MSRAQSSSANSKPIRTVAISRRALTARLNRVLARDGRELRKTRGVAIQVLGNYHIVGGGSVVSHHINDLEAFGRKLGALADYERLLIED